MIKMIFVVLLLSLFFFTIGQLWKDTLKPNAFTILKHLFRGCLALGAALLILFVIVSTF